MAERLALLGSKIRQLADHGFDEGEHALTDLCGATDGGGFPLSIL